MRRLLALLIVLLLFAKPGIAQELNPTGDGREPDRHALCQQLAHAARVHLRSDRMADAMNVLGEAADLNLPLDEGVDDGLGSAAAGWNRRLAALNTGERFELLHRWSMPTESRRTVRVLTSITPVDSPPSTFARAMGERPRRDSFTAPAIGGVAGLFNSAWELAKAADEVGYLRRLTAELSDLTEQDVPNAAFALTVARIVGASRPDETLRDELATYVNDLRAKSSLSRLTVLPPEQRVWQFGYGQFDEAKQRTAGFTFLAHWDGSAWRATATLPDAEIGAVVKAEGGHPGTNFAAIRRWVAPADGVLSVSGELSRPDSRGNGVRGRLISSRLGLSGQWTVRTGAVPTPADAIEVRRGDTIDLMVDAVDGDVSYDTFSWTTQFILKADDAKQLTYDSLTGFHGPAKSDTDIVIAAACLTREWLQSIGEDVFRIKVVEHSRDPVSPTVRSFLRYAHATAIWTRYPEASPNEAASTDFALWVPASGQEALRHAQGSVRPMWLSHDNHILHQAGPQNDYLFFKYPLLGEFEFSCDTQLGGGTNAEGGVAYGGLGYEISASEHLLKVWDTNAQNLATLHCPFVANNALPTFNKLSLKSSGDGVTLATNLHPTWTDLSTSGTSPWIGLRSFADRVSIFRNPRIVGNPVIPRQVNMTEGNSLRGWEAGYYGERTPPPGPAVFNVNALWTKLTTKYDWFAAGGIIFGTKSDTAGDSVSQSRLYYLRPLLNDESISYEFQYEPGQLEVHPTLGRIAYLIEPDGVRLHWMTDGEYEWTGLAEDNSVVEPLNRRGPKQLPLVAGEWNRVTLSLKKDLLTLSLNETTIYARKLEENEERAFGFYRDRNRSEARIRSVVLRGDWPERLTKQQLNDLVSESNQVRSIDERMALGAILDDRHVHGSVIGVHRRALTLTSTDRYAFLTDWVLPSPDHSTLRLALDFTPTNPAPPVSDENAALESGRSRVTTGGDLISPALDLVAVAKELHVLKDLRERVASMPAIDDQQRRSQLCMLALVDIGLGDLGTTKETLNELASIVTANPNLSFLERWPETLAIWEAARFAETRESVRDMLYQVVEKQIRKNLPSGYDAWDQQMRALASRLRYFDLRDRQAGLVDASSTRFSGQSPLRHWIPANRETARTRGQGFPRSQWELVAPDTVENFGSHEDNYLFYRIPLRGNFEVECQVTGFGWRESNLWVAEEWVAPTYTFRDYDVGDIREGRRIPLDPPMAKTDDWIRYRAVVRDGVCTTYFNGRRIHERTLPAKHEPWIAIRSPYHTDGAVRDLRITGNPEIPAEVELTNSRDLSAWLPINHGHRVGPTHKWRPLGDGNDGGGIYGIRWEDLPGSHRETLLRYHRPMVEDGTIEYEFFYREGETHVHPALDRLAFLLQPDGVRIHWVTDCEFDRTELAPDNLYDEPDYRRGPAALPLNPKDWNRLQLTLTGDTAALTLNGTLIYERPLEPMNQRTFGLFHYADQTDARVRNVVWRGDWPRKLPSLSDQELAGEGTEFLDKSLTSLTASFHHDFVANGMPSERFGLTSGKLDHFDARSDGLRVVRPGGEGYNDSEIAPHLSVEGDFDIIASFDQFDPHPTEGGSSGAFLRVVLDSEKSNECLVLRRYLMHRSQPQTIIQSTYVTREALGARRDRFPTETADGVAGRLRLARRGDTVYYLYAENDSPHFRLLATEPATKASISANSVRLVAQTQGEGSTHVVWKSLSIRAEGLAGLALTDADLVLEELNKQRAALVQKFEHDFAKDPFSEERFHRWRAFPLPDTNGLRMFANGANNWVSTGLAPHVGFEGDFDIEVTFDDLRLGMPKEKQNSALYLQVEFPDAATTQANILLVLHPDGERQAYAQIKSVGAAGNAEYRRPRIAPVGPVEGLRIARRGKRLLLLFREKGVERDTILAEAELHDLPIPETFVRIMLHSGGAGVQSDVLLKRFRIQAEKVVVNPAAAALRSSP